MPTSALFLAKFFRDSSLRERWNFTFLGIVLDYRVEGISLGKGCLANEGGRRRHLYGRCLAKLVAWFTNPLIGIDRNRKMKGRYSGPSFGELAHYRVAKQQYVRTNAAVVAFGHLARRTPMADYIELARIGVHLHCRGRQKILGRMECVRFTRSIH